MFEIVLGWGMFWLMIWSVVTIAYWRDTKFQLDVAGMMGILLSAIWLAGITGLRIWGIM